MTYNVDILSDTKKAFWSFSIPLICLSLFQAGYSLVDMYWISQYSQEAFFAVSVSSPIIMMMMGSGSSIATGATSIISRELGQKDYEGSYNSILHAIVACIVLSIIFMCCTLFLKEILALMNVTTSIDLVMAYLTPMLLCAVIFLLSGLLTNTLQAEGNSKIPTGLLIFTNVFNLVIDPVFIFVLNLGVRGAAYASILSTLISVVFLLFWYLSGRSQVVLNFKYFKPGIVYEIFKVAIPNFVMILLGSASTMYFNRIIIDQIGNVGVLLLSTSVKLESLVTSPQKGLQGALTTISGQLFGANEIDELKYIFNYAVKISMGLALLCAIIFFFVRDYGFALFSVTGVETYVFYIALAAIILLPVTQVSMAARNVLNGIGKSYHSLILGVISLACEIILITVLAPILTSGACILVGIMVTEIAFAVIYYILIRDLLKGRNKLDDKIESKKAGNN